MPKAIAFSIVVITCGQHLKTLSLQDRGVRHNLLWRNCLSVFIVEHTHKLRQGAASQIVKPYTDMPFHRLFLWNQI